MATTENLLNLKIHKLSQTQYENLGTNKDPNALYLTPEEPETYDLSVEAGDESNVVNIQLETQEGELASSITLEGDGGTSITAYTDSSNKIIVVATPLFELDGTTLTITLPD